MALVDDVQGCDYFHPHKQKLLAGDPGKKLQIEVVGSGIQQKENARNTTRTGKPPQRLFHRTPVALAGTTPADLLPVFHRLALIEDLLTAFRAGHAHTWLAGDRFQIQVEPHRLKLEQFYILKYLIGLELSLPTGCRYRSGRGSAQAQLNAARADLLPDFFATYSHTIQRPVMDNGAVWDNRWQAQLGAEWDLFNGLKHAAALQRCGGNLSSAEAGLETLQAELALEAQGAFLDYEQAHESLKLQAANIDLAGRNRAIAEEKYTLGLISVLELQDVQLALSQARLNYQQALYDQAIAVAALERLSGKSPEEQTHETASLP